MGRKERIMTELRAWKKKVIVSKAIHFSLRNFMQSILVVALASMICSILLRYTGIENNSALIYVFAVMIISRITTGYLWGILASIISAFSLNYYFMYPYASFNFTISGYQVALFSMVAVSILTGTMTTRIKQQAEEAIRREKRAKELYEMNQRLEAEHAAARMEAEMEKIRSNLLRSVSHDLRTPLTTIIGATSVILENGKDMSEEECLRLLLDIQQDATWLISMVENLLSVTRINDDAAELKLQMEIVDEVVGDAVQKVRKRFPEDRITVTLPDEILMIWIDPILIKQAVINLLENAIRHSGDKEFISLNVYRQEEFVIFEISDRGRGLLASRKDEAKGDTGRGLGIGLSICQSIVRAHHGFLESEENPLGGAIFRFGLPLSEEVNDGDRDL